MKSCFSKPPDNKSARLARGPVETMNKQYLRILYVCPDPGIPIFGRKGCSTHVRETCKFLVQRNHTVHLIAANPGEDFPPETSFTYSFFKPFQMKALGKDVRLLLDNVHVMRKVLHSIRTLKPHIIYERYSLYSRITELLARIYKIPRILEINSPLAYEQQHRLRLPRLAQIVENHIFLNAPYVIVVSNVIKEHLQSLGVPEDRIYIQPIAVDSQFFESARFTPPAEIQERCKDRVVIGYVGTLLHYHRVHVLFDLARELTHRSLKVIFLMIGGEQQKVEKYQDMAKKEGLGDLFIFIGSINYQNLPSYLEIMDIGIIPNTAPWAAPTKMFEYAAMRKPIIAPDYPAIRNFIPAESEWLLFMPETLDGVPEKIERLVVDPALRKHLGELNRRRVMDGFTWQHYIDKFETIAHRALDSNKSSVQ